MIKRFLERYLTYPQYKQILGSNFIKKNIHVKKPLQIQNFSKWSDYAMVYPKVNACQAISSKKFSTIQQN